MNTPDKTPLPFVFDKKGAEKRHAPATMRNRAAICAVLTRVLPDAGNILEIASGSGEHIIHFADAFPNLTWQPSDMAPAALQSIAAWLQEAGLQEKGEGNIAPPIALDVLRDWPKLNADALICINMLHISPWSATEALFAGASKLLPSRAPLFIYGPFLQPGVETAQSNLAFDGTLKARDVSWGLRDIRHVEKCANAAGFDLHDTIPMPANNLSMIFRRR